MKDRAPAKSFEDLVVWQKSHALTLKVYALTGSFPKDELYGPVSQMRRASVSISANIAEGFKRRGRPDKARFMNLAQGSLEELRYYFILAADLGFLKDRERESIDEVGRMLGAYTQTVLSSAF